VSVTYAASVSTGDNIFLSHLRHTLINRKHHFTRVLMQREFQMQKHAFEVCAEGSHDALQYILHQTHKRRRAAFNHEVRSKGVIINFIN
jgi:hypothetical protein